jgi:hypothetical protein
MVIDTTNGMIDQTVSRTIDPCISSGVANFSVSLYLMANTKTATTMGIEKAMLIRIR